jgi:Toprim-like
VLAPTNDLLGMLITEGVDDALALHEATGLGAWAAGSAPLMPYLAGVVPSFIEAVTAVGDSDENGIRYASELAVRLRARGCFDVDLKFLRASHA